MSKRSRPWISTQLRTFWRRRYGAPPALRSEPIMRMLLAWRVQAEDARRARCRDPQGACPNRLSRSPRAAAWRRRSPHPQLEGPKGRGRGRGRGFRWDGELFPSLSAAATAIAGSRWNGPRFFGLRDAA